MQEEEIREVDHLDNETKKGTDEGRGLGKRREVHERRNEGRELDEINEERVVVMKNSSKYPSKQTDAGVEFGRYADDVNMTNHQCQDITQHLSPQT